MKDQELKKEVQNLAKEIRETGYRVIHQALHIAAVEELLEEKGILTNKQLEERRKKLSKEWSKDRTAKKDETKIGVGYGNAILHYLQMDD